MPKGSNITFKSETQEGLTLEEVKRSELFGFFLNMDTGVLYVRHAALSECMLNMAEATSKGARRTVGGRWKHLPDLSIAASV